MISRKSIRTASCLSSALTAEDPIMPAQPGPGVFTAPRLDLPRTNARGLVRRANGSSASLHPETTLMREVEKTDTLRTSPGS